MHGYPYLRARLTAKLPGLVNGFATVAFSWFLLIQLPSSANVLVKKISCPCAFLFRTDTTLRATLGLDSLTLGILAISSLSSFYLTDVAST